MFFAETRVDVHPEEVDLVQIEIAAHRVVVGENHRRRTALAATQAGKLRHPMPAGQRHRADDRVLDALRRRLGRNHRKPVAQLQMRRPEEMVGHDAIAALFQLGDGFGRRAFDETRLQQRIGAAERHLRVQADHDDVVLPDHRIVLFAAGDVGSQFRLFDGQRDALVGPHALDGSHGGDLRVGQPAALERHEHVGHPIAGLERFEHRIAPNLHGHEQPQAHGQRRRGAERAPQIAAELRTEQTRLQAQEPGKRAARSRSRRSRSSPASAAGIRRPWSCSRRPCRRSRVCRSRSTPTRRRPRSD